MKIRCFTAVSPPILLASLLVVGCGSEADGKRERGDQGVKPDAATSRSDPLPKQVGDKLATDFRKVAVDAEQAIADSSKRRREFDKAAQDSAAFREVGKSLTKTGDNKWLPLMKAINEAIASVSGDPDKRVVVVDRLSSERSEDLSDWFGSLPSSATAKLSEEDRRTPPAGAGWLWTLEFRVQTIAEDQKERVLTQLVERLRKSRLPDPLRLTHPILKRSGEKTAITFVVRNT